jgi:uncharacterized membrane protein
MRIALWLHLLGTVVWVGGMFFAHVALRPAALQLPPPVRLPLMAATLGTFFRWVAAAVVAIIVSGFLMIAWMGGFASLGVHIHAMTTLGLVMASVFGYIIAVPYPRLRAALASGALPAAGEALVQIRRLVGFNLVVGLATITVAVLGHGIL